MDCYSTATKAVSTPRENTSPCHKNTTLRLQCPDADALKVTWEGLNQLFLKTVGIDDEGKADSAPDTETPEEVTPAAKQVRIVCGRGSVNVRVGNDTKYGRITSVKDGATYEWIATAENGWHAIVINAQIGWVSGKYSTVA